MSNKMVFFNKEGDALNILYNNNSKKYEGKLFFDENSDDTFKTIGLYNFEKISPFTYQLSSTASDYLKLTKFQLFNENGVSFVGASVSATYSLISKVEASNKKSNYFSKWVYGDKFDSLYNIGSEIKFNSNIYEFNDPTKTYTVVGTKKGALMILSDMNNSSFSASYSSVTISNTSSISEINAVKIYDYADINNNSHLSNWNQFDFTSNLFVNQKLSIVNSLLNNKVVTVNNVLYKDKTYYNSALNVSSLENATYYKCRVEVLTQNLPFFSGAITLTGASSKIDFNTTNIPFTIINGSTSFSILNSTLNTTSFTTQTVKNFEYGRFYKVSMLVLFDKKVYVCTTNYTSSTQTNVVNPKDLAYWALSTFLYVNETLTNETLPYSELYLTKNIIDTTTQLSDTTDKAVLLASGVDTFNQVLTSFNVSISYDSKQKSIKATPNIPSKYVDVKFIVPTTTITNPTSTSNVTGLTPFSFKPLNIKLFLTRSSVEKEYIFAENTTGHFYFYSGTSSSIPLKLDDITTASKLYWNSTATGLTLAVSDSIRVVYEYDATIASQVLEKVISVTEPLIDEQNKTYSKNKVQKVVITDLDEFGLNIFINKKLYFTPTQEIFNDVELDMSLTIDKTITKFIATYSNELEMLGILVKSDYYGVYDYDISNTITFTTMYPNVTCDITVNVGTTANFYLPLKHVVFYSINTNQNSLLKITVNNILYSIPFNTSISQTLIDWVDTYSDRLAQLNILVNSNNSILYFNSKDSNVKVNLSINTGNVSYLGNPQYEIFEFNITDKSIVISSNSVNILSNAGDFEAQNFATGQIVNIQNSVYPLNNKEYNITYLNSDKIIFSYQGAFFDVYDKSNIGSTASLTYYNGNYFLEKTLENSTVVSDLKTFTINGELITFQTSGFTTIVNAYDIIKYNLLTSTTIPYVFTNYEFNTIDNLLYVVGYDAVSTKIIIRFDPIIKTVVDINTCLTGEYTNVGIDTDTGDVYAVRNDSSNTFIDIFTIDNQLSVFTTVQSIIYTNAAATRVIYNKKEKVMYAFNQGTSNVLKIHSIINVETVCSFPNLNVSSVYYDYINGLFCAFNTTTFNYIFSGVVYPLNTILYTTNFNIIVNPHTYSLYVSTDNGTLDFFELTFNGTQYLITENFLLNILGGDLLFNNIDGNIYISKSTELLIFSTVTNTVFYTMLIPFAYNTKLINSEKENIILFNKSNSLLQDVSFKFTLNDTYKIYSQIYVDNVVNKIETTESKTESSTIGFNDGYYGSLSPNFVNDLENSLESNFIKLSVREYIRFPRENYQSNGDVQVKYIWKWLDDLNEDIFLYDVTGSQINYSGVLPLNDKNLSKKTIDSNNPQTVFSELSFTLDYIDSSTDITFEPEPLQVFIGFNSKNEGVSSRTLQMYKFEEIIFDIPTDLNNYLIFSKNFDNFGNELNNGTIRLSDNATVDFISEKFKVDQVINISILDKVNPTYKKISSENHNKTFKITEVFFKSLTVEYIDIDNIIVDEETIIDNTQFTVSVKTIPYLITELVIYGQTEIEDHRYFIELANTGKLINPDEVYIFKEYDINEGGIDWLYLNKKRKEMILVRNDIFNYIGSYKAIINAINYFGYNDLDLYEYFRNINLDSSNYGKLLKIKIPDIFNNDVVGWKTDLFFENLYPNDNYEETNLFNLTYKITDDDGNNILLYSLDEVLIKLFGLKKWLEKTVVPITHKINDITGLATVKNNFYMQHQNYDVTFLRSSDTLTPVKALVKEVYKLPVDSGSSVYNVVVDFESQENPISQFTLDIRTYKVYDEWETFKNYKEGDIVTYYAKIYEAQIDNQNFNPLKYSDISEWDSKSTYKEFDIVKYKRDFYSYQFLTPINTYDYILFGLDLYNESNNIDVAYLTVATQSDYIARDIIDAIQSSTHTPIAFTYGQLSFTNYTKTVDPYTLYNLETSSYDYFIGYNSQIVASTSTFSTSFTHSITISTNPQSSSDTIYNGGTLGNTATIEFTPNISVSAMTASVYCLNIATFSTTEGITIDIYYEFKPSQYSLLGTILENTTNSYIFPFFNSVNVSKPKFKFIVTTNIDYDNNTYATLASELNSTFHLTFGIQTNLNDSTIVEHNPDILSYNDTYQATIAQIYFNYIATTASYVNIKPFNLTEANVFLDNMIKLFVETRSNYKTQYSYLNPVKNIRLNNSEFVLWNKITVWKEIDLNPVQKLIEHRFNGNMLPYNFTLDSKIDPFVLIDVISDNGYGLSYKHTKTYEVRYNADKL